MKILGQVTSGFLGIYVVYRVINYIMNVVVTSKILYDLLGWSLSLIASISSTLSKYLIHWKTLEQRVAKKTVGTPLEEPHATEESVTNNTRETTTAYPPLGPQLTNW